MSRNAYSAHVEEAEIGTELATCCFQTASSHAIQENWIHKLQAQYSFLAYDVQRIMPQ
jgi:hypothetical protein